MPPPVRSSPKPALHHAPPFAVEDLEDLAVAVEDLEDLAGAVEDLEDLAATVEDLSALLVAWVKPPLPNGTLPRRGPVRVLLQHHCAL